MKKWKLGLLVLLAFYVSVGCTARSQTIGVRPLTTSLRPYTDVRVSVQSQVNDDASKEVADLEELVVSEIAARGTFQTVELLSGRDSPPGTLIVDVAISELKKVGSAKRFLAGAFAGRASMSSVVTLMDGRGGNDIGTYRITGESGGSGYSGGTDDAVKKTASRIAEILAENYEARPGTGAARTPRPSAAPQPVASTTRETQTAQPSQRPSSQTLSPSAPRRTTASQPRDSAQQRVSSVAVPAPPARATPNTAEFTRREAGQPQQTTPVAVPSDPAQAEKSTDQIAASVRPSAPPADEPAVGVPATAGQELIAAGNLAEAASAFLAELRFEGAGKFTVAVGVFCDSNNVAKLFRRSGNPGELFILARRSQGRSCYSVFWGRFDSRESARSAMGSIPNTIRSADQAPISIARVVQAGQAR